MRTKTITAMAILNLAAEDPRMNLEDKGLLLTIVGMGYMDVQMNGMLKISSIAKYAGIGPGQATKIIKGLIDKGYITEGPQKQTKLEEIFIPEQSWMK